MKKSQKIDKLSPKIRTFKTFLFTKKNMGLFLAQLCMFITSQKILENSIPFERIFFNTSLKVSQKNKCISIVVVYVFNFKNASRLYEHPIYIYIYIYIPNIFPVYSHIYIPNSPFHCVQANQKSQGQTSSSKPPQTN